MLGSIFSRLTGGGGGDESADHAAVEAAIKSGSHAIVDVREPYEYAAGHIPGSVNVPMSRFSVEQLPQGKPLILTCASGGRSAYACGQARRAGRADVLNHRGGVGGWAAHGGKITR